MDITILGRGQLAESLARLAERAGYHTQLSLEGTRQPNADSTPDLVILVGTRTVAKTMLPRLSARLRHDLVVVDATIEAEDRRHASEAGRVDSAAEWIAAILPRARVVRAFASVPADAFAAVLDQVTSDASTRLAVPLAGDDRQAKVLVADFMHAIGVESVDLGALTNVDVLEPGGALWGRALSQLEMLEAVGWLSGDG